jgi:outer membrane protein assembly factor BamB
LATTDSNYRLAVLTAAIAGAFSLIVCALLLYDYSRRDHGDPLENEAFLALKAALAKQPDNDELKSQIRSLDLRLRHEYFRQRAFTVAGAALLLGGVAVFLASTKTAATLRRELPHPQPASTPQDVESQWTRIGRWAVAAVALMLAATAIVLSFNASLSLPPPPQTDNKGDGISGPKPTTSIASAADSPPAKPTVSVAETLPTADEYAKAWPSFRGPGGRATSAYDNIPTEWDAASGKNIRWKTPVPLPGNSSPVVWGDRVYLTGANEKRREVYCFDAATGKMLWQKEAPGTAQSTAKPPKVNPDTGYAASSAATDGRRVFAIFANGDLAAFDFNGNLVWSKSLGIPDNTYGHASSLVTHKNLLIVQFDQGSSAKDAKSRLLAFDSATGNPAWHPERPVRNSWPSPIVIHAADRDQIITAAAPWVISYDPLDGSEIWRAKCFSPTQDIGPSPAYAAGKVFVANESAALSAIRADGKGDVTATHIAWKGEDGLPDACSPLATEKFLFLLNYNTVTCYDTENGSMLWTEDFDDNFTSSPTMAGKNIYLFGVAGKSWVAEPTREKCLRVAECSLAEDCVTTPAFQDGCFYIRGEKHLFCIGSKRD